MAVRNAELAAAIARAVAAFDKTLILFGLPGSEILNAGRAAGLRVAAEVFADRAYEPDGSLASRRKPGSVIHDAAAVVARAVRMVKEQTVVAIDGSIVALEADTICVHGDTPGSDDLAAKIRAGLEAAGITVKAIGRVPLTISPTASLSHQPSAPIRRCSAGGARPIGERAARLRRRRARLDARLVRRDALRDGRRGADQRSDPPSVVPDQRPARIDHAARRRRRRHRLRRDRRSPRPQARADGRDPDVLDLHRGLRLLADGDAARDLPRLPRPRHGRRVGDRRGAGLGVVSGAASRQGARLRPELVGDRLRLRGAGQPDRHADLGLARRLLRRRPAGAVHDVDPPQRRGAADLARQRRRRTAAASACCSRRRSRRSPSSSR